MSDFWKNQKLEGNGLQTINQQYSRLKRNTKTAYILCTLFPIGVHAFYLKNPKRGILYLSLSIAGIIAYTVSPFLSAFVFLSELVLLFVDVNNADDKVVAFNKKLKMRLSLQPNAAAPKGFRGRYFDETPIDDYMAIKDNEVTAFETKKASSDNKPRVFSFDEQEKMLKEMTKNKKKR